VFGQGGGWTERKKEKKGNPFTQKRDCGPLRSNVRISGWGKKSIERRKQGANSRKKGDLLGEKKKVKIHRGVIMRKSRDTGTQTARNSNKEKIRWDDGSGDT